MRDVRRQEKVLRIWLAVLLGVVVVMTGALAATVITDSRNHPPANPYEIAVPGQVDDVDSNGQAITKGGRLRIITDRCNTTDDVIVLDIETSWLLRGGGDEPNIIVAGPPLPGISVQPGGSLCDPPTMDPIVSGIPLPEQVIEAGGVWQYQSQITVSSCLATEPDPDIDGHFDCIDQGPVIDSVGWFSERFRVS